jgi:hypothetical protein
MTFDSNITEANHQIIKNEIKRKNLLIAKKATYIVEKINYIISDKKPCYHRVFLLEYPYN